MKKICFIATIGLLFWGQYACGQQLKINQSQQEKTYQIQIYNGTISEANEEIKRASGKYSYPCFLAFETPNYKVRMGQFRTRLEAEKALTKVKNMYPAAFVIAPY